MPAAAQSLCLVMSYSLWKSLQTAAEFEPMECTEDFPLASVSADGFRFLVAARSSSIRYPHTLSYGAIARELRRAGCTHVISSALCQALDADAVVPSLVILDQFIDLHRIMETPVGEDALFQDFSSPYCQLLRSEAFAYLSRQERYPVLAKGCCVGVDGPRHETTAEVRAYGILGGDVVGMTAVREAVAYRNAGLCIATVALITDHGAGLAKVSKPAAEIQRASEVFGQLLLDCGRHLAMQKTTFECVRSA